MAEENNHAADDDIDQEDIRNLHIDGEHFEFILQKNTHRDFESNFEIEK